MASLFLFHIKAFARFPSISNLSLFLCFYFLFARCVSLSFFASNRLTYFLCILSSEIIPTRDCQCLSNFMKASRCEALLGYSSPMSLFSRTAAVFRDRAERACRKQPSLLENIRAQIILNIRLLISKIKPNFLKNIK